jgi:hypothetical protein
MISAVSVHTPVKVIIRWKGIASTPSALCPSSHERWPLPGRNVKKSLKMRRCAMIPVISAPSITSPAIAASSRPHG